MNKLIRKFINFNILQKNFLQKLTYNNNKILFNMNKLFTTNIDKNNIEIIKEVVGSVKSEDGKNLFEIGLIFDIKQEGEKTKILLNLNKDYRKIKNLIEIKLTEKNIDKNKVEVTIAPQEKNAMPPKKTGLEKVKNIIAVYSCKGGVGKSTIAINLAFSLLKVKNKNNQLNFI
jgi:ATP-binding protein involved in chromosome partitioning